MNQHLIKVGLMCIGILIPTKTVACSCPIKKLAEMQKTEIETAECIFIGEIIDSNEEDYSFTIRVIESLDGGDDPNNVYVAKSFTTCDIFTDRLEKWIIYGHTEGDYLTLFECGLSRPVGRPYTKLQGPEPLKEVTNESDSKELYQNNFELSLKQAKTDLNSEIELLRKLRDECVCR